MTLPLDVREMSSPQQSETVNIVLRDSWIIVMNYFWMIEVAVLHLMSEPDFYEIQLQRRLRARAGVYIN